MLVMTPPRNIARPKVAIARLARRGELGETCFSRQFVTMIRTPAINRYRQREMSLALASELEVAQQAVRLALDRPLLYECGEHDHDNNEKGGEDEAHPQ